MVGFLGVKSEYRKYVPPDSVLGKVPVPKYVPVARPFQCAIPLIQRMRLLRECPYLDGAESQA